MISTKSEHTEVTRERATNFAAVLDSFFCGSVLFPVGVELVGFAVFLFFDPPDRVDKLYDNARQCDVVVVVV
jgi:hypothetical protein